MDRVFAVALFVLYAATLYAIRRWIQDMPVRLWGIARSELDRVREEDAAKAEKAFQEAAERRVRALVASLRNHEAGVAAQYRQGVADAQAGARAAGRDAANTAAALAAAATLARELRAALEGLVRAGHEVPLAVTGTALAEPATCAKPPDPTVDDEQEEEPTQVAMRPVSGPHPTPGNRSPLR